MLALLVASTPASFADGGAPPGQAYFFSMRAPDIEPAPRYVAASATPADDQTAAIAGCDGETYFLTPANAATVRAALANGNTVELQVADPGQSAPDSRVRCLMQASN